MAASLAQTLNDVKKTQEKQEAIANSPLQKFGANALKLLPPLKNLGIAAAGAGLLGTTAAATVAGVGTAGAVYNLYKTVDGYKGLANDGAAVLGNLFLLASKEEEREAPKFNEFLETFCVDPETLDLIEDRYQNEYINESGIIDELKAYIENPENANNPIPDITAHLVNWINTQSDYKNSDDTVLVTKK